MTLLGCLLLALALLYCTDMGKGPNASVEGRGRTGLLGSG